MKKPRAVHLSFLFLLLLAGCMFQTRPDGAFSQDFDRYAYGRWEQKDQQLQHKTIAWSNSDSKYKMFLGAFQQLEKFLHS